MQLKAIEYLYRARVQVQPAVMVSFSPAENIRALRKRLGTIAPSLEDIEMEELVLYGDVEKRLRSAKIGVDEHLARIIHEERKGCSQDGMAY